MVSNKKNNSEKHKTIPFTKRTSKYMKKLNKEKKKIKSHKHGKDWHKDNHYMFSRGYQCGQSCPCCRARAFNTGVDTDGWFGACQICLKKE
tara:strand:- start:2518 stop:2790 length:273 start_codon:yes stop_codon:yes gene_type:complete